MASQALAQIRAIQRPGQPDLLGKIIGLYLEDTPKQLQRMRAAVAGEEYDALRRAAHGLKSSSANLGATQVAALSKDLEQRGRERRLEGAAELLQTLETHYLQARDALTGELEKGFLVP